MTIHKPSASLNIASAQVIKLNNYRDIFKSLVLRGIIGLPLLVGGIIMLFSASDAHNPGIGLYACALIIPGAIVLAYPLARFLAEPAGSLFYPVTRASGPQPMYSIPESRRAKGLYEEAMAGFEKIAEDYPNETKPYIEMIDIAICDLKDSERANEIYKRGVSVMKKDEDKEVLARMYSAIRTRLNSKPSN
ncbi:hypothetical protein ACFLS1_05485 [Verrucomicrobiota bacterium]